MINLVGKHGPQDCMTQVIVAFISCQISKQMLDGVIDMLFCGNLLVISVQQCLTILLSTVLSVSASIP